MIHTFEVYCTVGYNQAMNIRDDFGVSRARNRFSVKGKINGIAKISLFPQADRTGYTFMVEVNPAKLLYGYDAFETVTADDDTLERLSQAFYDALNELTDAADLPMLPDWFARRIDYAVDVRTAHINEYVKLLNKGDKPSAYTSRPKGEMGSCYWQCKSMTGNVYTKADQMAKSGKPQHLIERAKDICGVPH